MISEDNHSEKETIDTILPKIAVFRIDTNKNEPEAIQNPNQLTTINDYVKDLRTEIINSSRKKAFDFNSDTTELYTCIKNMFAGNFDKNAFNLAKRLLRTEKQTCKEYSHLKFGIQKGSLVVSFFPENENIYIILAKTDYMEFIDETNFDKRQGLPTKKKIFKAFCGKFSSTDMEEYEMFVFDSTNEIARYWWNNFLELKETRSSEHNTINFMKGLDHDVFSKIKKTSPGDYIILRNSTIGYFRNNNQFDINDYCNSIINDYNPILPNKVNVDNLKNIIYQIPEKHHCDSQFEINRSSISAKKITKISLLDNINLELVDSINDLDDIIKSMENDGEKGVFIKSEKGYEHFLPKD